VTAFAAFVSSAVRLEALQPAVVSLAGCGEVTFTPMCDGQLWPGSVLVVVDARTSRSVYRAEPLTGILHQLSGTRDWLAGDDCPILDLCRPLCREVRDIDESLAIMVHKLSKRTPARLAQAAAWRDAAVEAFLSGEAPDARLAKRQTAHLMPAVPAGLQKAVMAKRRLRLELSPGLDVRR
jgi:hypothetical protein